MKPGPEHYTVHPGVKLDADASGADSSRVRVAMALGEVRADGFAVALGFTFYDVVYAMCVSVSHAGGLPPVNAVRC